MATASRNKAKRESGKAETGKPVPLGKAAAAGLFTGKALEALELKVETGGGGHLLGIKESFQCLANLFTGLEPTGETSKSNAQNSGNNQSPTLKIRSNNAARRASALPPI